MNTYKSQIADILDLNTAVCHIRAQKTTTKQGSRAAQCHFQAQITNILKGLK